MVLVIINVSSLINQQIINIAKVKYLQSILMSDQIGKHREKIMI